MTTTEEVPMPEPDIYRYNHWIDGPRQTWSSIRLDHSFTWPGVIGYVQGEPHFSLPKLRAYADARCAKLQAKIDAMTLDDAHTSECTRIVYDELQRVAPWPESNDMDWADEMICGIKLLAQERDALAEKVKDQQQLIRDLFAQYTKFYGVPVDQPPFIYHNPAWQALLSRAIGCGAIDAAGGGGDG